MNVSRKKILGTIAATTGILAAVAYPAHAEGDSKAKQDGDPSATYIWENDGGADPDKADFYWDNDLAEAVACEEVEANPLLEADNRVFPGVTWTWYYDDSERPESVSMDSVLSTLTASFKAIHDLRNNCGITGDLNLDFKYGGERDHEQFTSEGTAYEINVSFADLAGSTVGNGGSDGANWGEDNDVPYVRARGHVKLDSDTNWMTPGAAGCPENFREDGDLQKTDMQSTVMHEIMHVLNVDHAEEDGTPMPDDTDNPKAYQTMASATATCTVFERTLGRGDIATLVDLYGTD
ncbi:hypothetical protein ABZ532_31145 [Streptomyces sp. NPDC019396]|uniref:hypothetical protein n=1 Tax=Streptomyces sp. NPDC019396 TaxID=3154687 RepID=UPI0034118F53